MVFLTAVNFLREFTKFGRPGGGPDKFWRVQQYLRFSWVWRCSNYTIHLYLYSVSLKPDRKTARPQADRK